jgi:hypothetical protein
LVERPTLVRQLLLKLAELAPEDGQSEVLIEGEGGVGKTGLLVLAGQRLCQGQGPGGQWYLPIGVPPGEQLGPQTVPSSLRRACGRTEADDGTILARIEAAADAKEEGFRVALFLDGLEEGADPQATLATARGLARAHSPRLVVVYSCRTRAARDEYPAVIDGYRGLDRQDGVWYEGPVEVPALQGREIIGTCRHLEMPDLAECLERTLGMGAGEGRAPSPDTSEWSPHLRVLQRLVFLDGLRQVRDVDPAAFQSYLDTIPLHDPEPRNEGLSLLAAHVVHRHALKENARRRGELSVIKRRLRDIAVAHGGLIATAQQAEVDVCKAAAESGLVEPTGVRGQWRWAAPFLREYLCQREKGV